MLALAWLVHRRPIALPLLAVAALPFRVPVSIGDSAANLLLPLYAVIAAGTLAYAWRALRWGGPDAEREPLLRRLAWAFAAVLALYGAAGRLLDRRRAGDQERHACSTSRSRCCSCCCSR